MNAFLVFFLTFLDEVKAGHWLDAAVPENEVSSAGAVPVVIGLMVVVALVALALIVRALRGNSGKDAGDK